MVARKPKESRDGDRVCCAQRYAVLHFFFSSFPPASCLSLHLLFFHSPFRPRSTTLAVSLFVHFLFFLNLTNRLLLSVYYIHLVIFLCRNAVFWGGVFVFLKPVYIHRSQIENQDVVKNRWPTGRNGEHCIIRTSGLSIALSQNLSWGKFLPSFWFDNAVHSPSYFFFFIFFCLLLLWLSVLVVYCTSFIIQRCLNTRKNRCWSKQCLVRPLKTGKVSLFYYDYLGSKSDSFNHRHIVSAPIDTSKSNRAENLLSFLTLFYPSIVHLGRFYLLIILRFTTS